MTDGAKNFSSDVHEPENGESIDGEMERQLD